jgi:ATP-dependent DNA helicase PIF1
MYVGGVGGTGKSHLINAVRALFTGLGRKEELIVSAPTGAAGVLIDGTTIHSLTSLPQKGNVNGDALATIWEHITFLIIDEISMVSAGLLADISERINLGKRLHNSSRDTPLGDINVVVTGDFGQLKPVGGHSLFSNLLIAHLPVSMAASYEGQRELLGIVIWRQFEDVVLLRQNQRQADDPAYASLIGRVRAGECVTSDSDTNNPSDYSTLRTRVLSLMAQSDPFIYTKFQDAPVIVGTRRLRDEINRQRLHQHAHRLDVTVSDYYSEDTLRKDSVPLAIRERLWRVTTTISKDALGVLPLFHGMKVMITENIAMNNRLVNGAEGVVQEIMYNIDDQNRRHAKVCLVLVRGCGIKLDGYDLDIVPLFPVSRTFTYTSPFREKFSISRSQLPLLPAYSYTDYKSQGRTLPCAIVDLESARSLQGVYVMLSRVKAMHSLVLLRPFKRDRIEQRLSEELRNEFRRLEEIDAVTKETYIRHIDLYSAFDFA